MRLLVLSSLLLLAGCQSPTKLPDPTIQLQPVPEQLLEPAQKMKTIPTEKPVANRN